MFGGINASIHFILHSYYLHLAIDGKIKCHARVSMHIYCFQSEVPLCHIQHPFSCVNLYLIYMPQYSALLSINCFVSSTPIIGNYLKTPTGEHVVRSFEKSIAACRVPYHAFLNLTYKVTYLKFNINFSSACMKVPGMSVVAMSLC